jgi:hypothetical protein
MLKKILFALAATLLPAVPVLAQTAPANYTYVYGNMMEDASGAPLNGTITFTPVSAQGQPISFRLGGGGQAILRAPTANVINGGFHINLADVNLASPSDFCYAVTAIDNTTGNTVLGGSDYSCLQPHGPQFDIDEFSTSTTPVLPIANTTYNGDLDIIGNINMTGSIYGAVNISNVDIAMLTGLNVNVTGSLEAATVNGVVNAAMMPGGDIGAQVNYAFANSPGCQAQYTAGNVGAHVALADCQVMIPPGVYTMTSPIHMPSVTSAHLTMYGAYLNVTGNGFPQAVVDAGIAADHPLIEGGVIYMANSTAKYGVALPRGSQGAVLRSVRVEGNHNDIGLVDLGANVVSIEDCSFQYNLVGIALEGSPGYASNNVKVENSLVSNNDREGLVDGDISQFPAGWPDGTGGVLTGAGSDSPNLGNYFIGNDFEGNGRVNATVSNPSNVALSYPQIFPAVRIALATGDIIEKNYFEVTPYVRIQLGNLPQTDTTWTNLFTPNLAKTNGGTAKGVTIRDNYFTGDTSHPGTEIRLNAAVSTTIGGNAELDGLPMSCFLDINLAVGIVYNPNDVVSNSQFCQGMGAENADGFALSVGTNHMANDLAIDGSFMLFSPSGGGAANTGIGRVGIRFANMSPLATGDPSCNPAYGNGFVWVDTTVGQMYVCQSDATAPARTGGGLCTNPSATTTDGNSTWCAK